MSANGWIQLAFFLAVLLLLAKPLGSWMARVYAGEPTLLGRLLSPIERLCYRVLAIDPSREMGWRTYAVAMLAFNGLSLLVVYAIQRFQGALPLNPQGFSGVPPALALNTAISFATNTNWQSYGGETTMSYFTQMTALAVQNFVSAASGVAVLMALIRGFARESTQSVGNFWADLVRGTLHVLLPLSTVLALLLVSQGAVQNFDAYRTVDLVQPMAVGDSTVTKQVLPMGPAASQIAIKQLGTNGGGFFNVNSAHPFENPTPFSNFLEVLAILLLPAALCYTYGKMVKDTRQGWAVLAAMSAIFIAVTVPAIQFEESVPPVIAAAGVDATPSPDRPGGNMEGKETRLGPVNSAIWSTATTAASNGSVNAMHDSFTPLGGMGPMWLMQLGEVVFGGIGSGLYGMLAFAIVAVFIAGLMVGRTPEYLGKKIEAYEMKMASLVVLIPPMLVLLGTALAVALPAGRAGIFNPGAHGFSEVLYAFSSASNNNGSGFAGLGANSMFYNLALGVAMLVGRYGLAIPILALAGSLAAKKRVPAGAGTLPTHTPLFVMLLIGTVLLVGALTFFPALALGPVVEHLQLFGH